MTKTLAVTFIIGVVTGSALTFYFTGKSEVANLPMEEKVISKTENRKAAAEYINGEVLDIPGETPEQDDSSEETEVSDSVGYEMPDEGIEAAPAQMDMFERSIASDPDTETTAEELPTSVPEEAPPEAPPEYPPEETNED